MGTRICKIFFTVMQTLDCEIYKSIFVVSRSAILLVRKLTAELVYLLIKII